MGLPREIAKAALRISLGWDSSAAEVDGFLARLGPVLRELSVLVP